MKKNVASSYRYIYCPMAKKNYVLSKNEKCCPCCGGDLKNPGVGHHYVEETITNLYKKEL